MIQIDDVPEEIRPFFNAVRDREDFPRRMSAMLGTLAGKLDKERVADLALKCRKMAPKDPVVWQNTEKAVRKCVPAWHFNIVSDARRNHIYDQSLKTYIQPDDRVLEVGPGSGFFSVEVIRRIPGGELVLLDLQPEMLEKAAA
ncbi:MAG: class I SAM-dependent methyltransferase [Desulfobacterales bacterium]|nr:class I SAM-dependent methyltransferase [Desulfobacterales bacterium]